MVKAFTENCKDHIVYFNDDNKENILDIVNPMVKIIQDTKDLLNHQVLN